MSVHRDDLGTRIFSFDDLLKLNPVQASIWIIGGAKNSTITSKITKIRKLLYGFSFRLLDYFRFEAPPPLILL